MNTLFKYILILLLASSSLLSAQIVSIISGNALASGNAEYPKKDTLFFFANITQAELSVAPVVGSNVTYTWEKYDKGIWDEVMISNDPNLATDVTEGAYRVSVKDNGLLVGQDTCWTFVPEFISLKVDTIYSNCINIQLTTIDSVKTLNYVDPANGNPYTVNYQLDYAWSSDPASAATVETDAQPIMNAPVEPTTYIVEVKAFKGASSLSANFVYDEPKAVEADFTFDVTDRGNKNELPVNTKFTGLTEYTGSSEISVSLNDTSKGFIDSYIFEIENESGVSIRRNLQLIEESIKEFGTYYMYVTVKNSKSDCFDKQKLGPIKIEDIYLDLPNVFTPDGDGMNDKFAAVYRSVKEFKMIIFNRWGRKVFQTTDPGEAWDGKIGGKNAAEGVYFYVVTAKGYNKGEERKREGPVHLLRGK